MSFIRVLFDKIFFIPYCTINARSIIVDKMIDGYQVVIQNQMILVLVAHCHAWIVMKQIDDSFQGIYI